MEKIISLLGYVYILLGFTVGIISYYYLIRQYKYTKAYYTQQHEKAKKINKIRKHPLVKSNITQYIDTDEINETMDCPFLDFLTAEKIKPIRITEEETIIGRSKTDDIIIDNPNVSRSHCVITKDNKKYFIKLTAPKNPILLNGKNVAIESEELMDGDTILMVNANIKFRFNMP